jgi:hypothetical protein
VPALVVVAVVSALWIAGTALVLALCRTAASDERAAGRLVRREALLADLELAFARTDSGLASEREARDGAGRVWAWSSARSDAPASM